MSEAAPQKSNDDDRDPSVQTVQDRLPSFMAEAFGDLYEEDGLVVIGRGLGLLSLLAAFVRYYCCSGLESEQIEVAPPAPFPFSQARETKKETWQRRPLVFVIGLKEGERSTLLALLERWYTPKECLPRCITNESGQARDRALLYGKGGVFLITSRILIVDLLTQTARPSQIAGILVAHAENVIETSTEAFIVRLYRTQRYTQMQMTSSNDPASGFVKAFTDNPEQLMSGFAKVDKILKSLFVRRVYLFPRFHESVVEELENNSHREPPKVVEYHQELTPNMKDIQAAVAAAVQTVIRELKKETTLIDWTLSEDLSVENCVTSNFDQAISRQLEHDWHRLRPHTKQLVADLRTLRTLFGYLLQYDSISFYKLLQNIKTMSASARNPSMWLLSPAAEILFQKAKERIFRVENQTPSVTSKMTKVIRPVLESNPKWKLLRKVLMEIQAEELSRQSRKRGADETSVVLIVVREERAVESVRQFLTEGREKAMTLRWLRFLEQINDKSRSKAQSMSEESRLLIEEEGRVRNHLLGGSSKGRSRTSSNSSTSKIDQKSNTNSKAKTALVTPEASGVKKRSLSSIAAQTQEGNTKKKKHKVAEERSRCANPLRADEIKERAALDAAVQEVERDMEVHSALSGAAGHFEERHHHHDESTAFPDTDQTLTNLSSGDDLLERSDDVDDHWFQLKPINDFRVEIRTYGSLEGDQSGLVLDDLKPSYVVLYDGDMSFIRSLEVHNSLQSPTVPRLWVYFLMFEASAEEKTFLKSIEKERDAFERLIQHKRSMALPMNVIATTSQELQLAATGGVAGTYGDGAFPLSMDTRTGRGKARSDQRRDVAVDVREFRSALPSILHQGGMRIAPVTLTVGDYILSNVHCVERKSISDLFGSFGSGRLYTQAESMCRHYKCPCLLIEFDPSKSFSLQNPGELGGDIRVDSVCSKMSLLVMHFPQLRILWSRGPYETLRTFRGLKINHEEVNVEKAVEIGSCDALDSIGRPSEADGGDDDGNADPASQNNAEASEAAREMLLRLPGVTEQNFRKIVSACDNIGELADMSREKLKLVAGPTGGQRLFTFFREKLV